MLKNLNSMDIPKPNRPKKPTVILYLHKISHNLKRIAVRHATPVLFSAPREPSSMVPRPAKRRPGQLEKGNVKFVSHHLPFVDCISNVICEKSFSCGKVYITQT